MRNQLTHLLRASWTLLRLIAVVSSSVVTIISSLLPLYLYTSLSKEYLIFMFLFLSVAAIIIHGGLTHLFNDHADYLSGTDALSPGVLSGGSRVIQKGLISPKNVWAIGKWLSISLLITAGILALFGRYDLTLLLVVGVWAAYSYSLPPFRLSYRPFVGEWLSLFPAIFVLGLAGPLIILESIPLWAYQNALINAFVCMGWVMVHHIPDVDADKKAIPIKQTSVVWFVDNFGLRFAGYPALLYFSAALVCSIWLIFDRFWAGIWVTLLLSVAIILIYQLQARKLEQVTQIEKYLLLIAVIIALILGVF